MKKLQIISMALVAVFALSALVVSSASAETTLLALFLVSGGTVAANTAATLTGGILLEVTSLKAAVTCPSVVADGLISGAESLFLVEKILNLAGTEIGEELTGTALVCEQDTSVTGNACEAAMAAEAWVLKSTLPWDFVFQLMENGTFLGVLTGGTAGYEVRCLIAGLNTAEKCTAPEGTSIENVNATEGVEAVGAGSPNANCSLGGTGTGINEALSGNKLTVAEGNLSLSE